MSTRPAAGAGTPTGRGGLSSYLRDRPIWVKLGLIMIVPTIATIVIGFGALVSNIGGASDAATVQSVASLNERIGALTDALQGERAAANTVLGDVRANPDIQADEVTRYKSLINVSKPIVEAYRTQRATLPDVGPALTAALNQAEEGLASLDSIRAKTTARSATQDSVIQWYNSIITSLQAVRQAGSLLAGDSQLSQAMQIANAVSAYKEAHAVERIKVDDALFTGRATAAQIYNVLAAVAEQATALSAIEPLAQGTDDWDYFKKVINDGTTNFISSAEAQAFQALDPSVGLNVQRSNWDEVVDTHIAKIREAEQYFDDKVSTEARVLHSNRQRSVLVEAALLLGLVLVAVLIAWLMARAMNRSLRELRHGALAIAQYGLPQAVARLRDPSLNTALSPHQVAQQIADPLPVRSRDEFGQVTEAFNAVHLEAVRTAAEQAALRASVATMFVNLARRSQILVDRLIGHLDRLERGEEDPDRLAELFQLDHLATRMRRNDENLLVLAGADSTRVQREPAALIDVLRAAQSEVEHYTRIEFGVIDRDIEIAAHAVNDLVHLVAELFDNATAFSPPDSTVVVEARRVGDRAVLYVEDHGIGISPDQLADLNERLATPPMVDVAVSRMMGLVVVARLAVRHGVKVELRPAHERGTIADVLLPTAVLVPRALAGRGPAAGMPTGQPEAGRGAYPPGSPLALESGPVGPVSPVSPAVGGEIPVGGFGTPFDPAAHGPAAGRNLPSWSDLTGAAGPVVPGGRTPHNGSDSYPGVNGAGPYGGAPHSGAPHGGPGLPIRRPGENEPAPTLGNGSEIPGSRPQVPRQTAASPEVAEGTSHRSAAWRAAADAIDVDPLEPPSALIPPSGAGAVAPPPPAAALPAWPPAGPVAGSRPEDEPVAPPVPENVVAALDITSEIPRIRRDDEVDDAVPAGYAPPTVPAEPSRAAGPAEVPATAKPASPVVEPTVPAAPLRVTQHADETMELPIFKELESAWFRTSFDFEFGSPTGDAATEPVAAGNGTAVASATASGPGWNASTGGTTAPPATEPADTGRPAGREPEPVGAGAAPRATRPAGGGSHPDGAAERTTAEPVWRTAADQGWMAAEAAARPQIDVTTEAGLPRRTPMAQLVPGGVDKPAAGLQKRSPEQVRGLLSAYHRGVQRGRSDGGSPSGDPPHSGKEQEA